ncbi:MAG TPA: DUF4238 domain-containing protein, partial [Longimicrobium sp.]
MAKTPQPTHKQHTVPQFYLRPFADANQKLWAYDKTNGSIFQVGIKDAAQKHGFFSLPEVDGSYGAGWFAETYFGQYETPAAEAIRGILTSMKMGIYSLISPPLKQILAEYAAVQYLRTQVSRSQLLDLHRAMYEASKIWTDVPELQGIPATPDPKELALHHLRSGLNPEKVKQTAETLHDHVWGLTVNRTGSPYYTSDHPLVLHSHEPRPGRGSGLGTFGVEVALPLAPHLLLHMVEREWAEQHYLPLMFRDGYVWNLPAFPESAMFYRSLQVRDSYRFVYGCAPEDFE